MNRSLPERPTACGRCKYHIHNADVNPAFNPAERPGFYLPYNHLCRASPTPDVFDPVQGKYVRNWTARYYTCHEINKGDCQLFEEKDPT